MVYHPLTESIGPVAGGIIAGLLHTVLGPDHLCTIVTLSACQGAKAFWFGVRWAGGHLAGMVVIGSAFALLNRLASNAAWEVYEYYADYVVGILLVTFGVYFIINADKYFDADWAPKQATCACHAHLLKEEEAQGNGHGHGHSHGDGKQCHSGHSHGDHGHCHDEHDAERQPLTGGDPSKLQTKQNTAREAGSVIVGFVQGVACPAGLVGVVFLKQYSPLEMLVFIGIFFFVTTLAMGTLAMCYGMVTQRCFSSAKLAKGIFYASCGLSVTLGITWLTLNAMGTLDAFLGHDHEDHDHGHGEHVHVHHAHAAILEEQTVRLNRFFLLMSAR